MSAEKAKRLSPQDPNSFARVDQVRVSGIHLKLDVNFDTKQLVGSAKLTLKKIDEKCRQLILDNRDLLIDRIIDIDSGNELKFMVGEKGYVGSEVVIELEENTKEIEAFYATSPESSALQWLPPAQTAGKRHPYMFSQCQAIHCRALAPLQDTPAVKNPYTAEITAPKELTVLMSAVPVDEPKLTSDGQRRVFKFEQKIPIQSYLIAIAVGNVESRRIGPRSKVWSEPEIVDKAAKEFADTEHMLKTAEDLCGPYVWGIYDILVLPPSFPYGGMENPCLTFATPTLLAGDKSLASVIAHEIAHSWTGNLVTNKNFEHFWLNEGFTVFTERKIIGRLHGESMRHFDAIGGWKDLKYGIDVLKHDNPLTALVLDLTGVDPDDAFSVVPYEKGSAFLWYLETLVGGPSIFEPFLKSYYEKFKYESIDSFQFKAFFLDAFKNVDKIKEIDWDSWFYKPGMPISKPDYDDSLAKVCKALKDKWVNSEDGFAKSDIAGFSAGQTIEFLSLMLEEEPLSVGKLEKMQAAYDFNSVGNSEIRFRWIRLGLRGKWKEAVPRAVQMLTDQGRMKFLRPLYRDLYAWEEYGRQIAIETFHKNKDQMMTVAVHVLLTDLKLKE